MERRTRDRQHWIDGGIDGVTGRHESEGEMGQVVYLVYRPKAHEANVTS